MLRRSRRRSLLPGFSTCGRSASPSSAGPPPIYNDLPMQIFPAERRVKFITVTRALGPMPLAGNRGAHRRRGREHGRRGGRPRGSLHGIPVGEVRGISNMVTNRDTSAWRLKDAALAAQEALLAWMSRR